MTYEVLAVSFGLAPDHALASIGAIVHFLDIGGIPVPDAKGLETVLNGIRTKARSDDDMVREAAKIFDLFYSAYADPHRKIVAGTINEIPDTRKSGRTTRRKPASSKRL